MAEQINSRTLRRRALRFAAPFRGRLIVIIGVALVLAALSAVEPLAMKYLFDEIASPHGRKALLNVAGGLAVLELFRAALNYGLSIVSWDVRLGIEYGIRDKVIGKLNTLPVTFHQKDTAAGTATKVTGAITSVVAAFAELAFTTVPTVAYLALAAISMWRLEPRLAVLVLVFAPMPAIIGMYAAAEQTSRERRLVERWTSIYGRFNEVLAGILTVKGFAMEQAERDRFLEGVREGNDVVRRGVRTDTRTGTLRSFAGTFTRLAALGAGGLLVLEGHMTVGTLVAFLGYIGGIFGPVQNLTNTYQTARRADVALEHIYGILDADDAVADVPDAQPVAALGGEIDFRDVSFGYHGGKTVLQNVSLRVGRGETVALVGASGSGKTTLTMLLQRLYPLSGGTIALDGVDIRKLEQLSLRRQIGAVFQDAHLFNDTVRANIAYGRPEATDAEIEAAARAAQAHDFIVDMPKGYDTPVGERGSRLSGGQRQRVAIARALLKNPPILVLDEATSALDAESEELVQRALGRLLQGRTAIVIAHRLSTVMQADRIVVIKDGRIAEIGSHVALMAEDGYYASLVRRQAKGFLLPQAA